MAGYQLIRGKRRTPLVQQIEEADLDGLWHRTLALETLGRNLETAGALELQFRLGLSHAEMKSMEARTKTRSDCSHPSTLRYSRVSVCTVCLRAVDRWL
jgi:hypothetical protein